MNTHTSYTGYIHHTQEHTSYTGYTHSKIIVNNKRIWRNSNLHVLLLNSVVTMKYFYRILKKFIGSPYDLTMLHVGLHLRELSMLTKTGMQEGSQQCYSQPKETKCDPYKGVFSAVRRNGVTITYYSKDKP